MTRGARVALAVVGAASAVLVTSCEEEVTGPVGAEQAAPPSIYALPPTVEVTAPPMAVDETVATFTRSDDRVVLPDPEFTPGATFTDVRASDICETYYTQGIRQPRFNDKVAAFASYGVSIHDRDIYQVDHLVPISLGGSNDQANLWPQPYDDRAGADQKDLVERQLRGLVCSNEITLVEAQRAIADDWWQAYQDYMGRPILPGTDGPEPWKRPEATAGAVDNGAPCEREGDLGYTEPKRIRLTCTVMSLGELRWQKRY